MTAPAASPQMSRRAPWALWTTLLAMLLAVQASAGAIRPAALAETGAVAARLTLPAPLAAQFRDTGHALKAAGQRLHAGKPQDIQDGGTPPLPAHRFAIPGPAGANEPLHPSETGTRSGDSSASPYRARAPPRVA